MGHNVIAVEPFYDNILRIHKAVKEQNLQHRVTLIANAISNKRNEIKLLAKNDVNIGGQSLIPNNHIHYNRDELGNSASKYFVETILLDDIVEFLPISKKHTKNKAILKIDIEGYEPYAFQHARRLFDEYNIQVIFMEWGKISNDKDNCLNFLLNLMVKFLCDRNYLPYHKNSLLDVNELNNWPWDVLWKKQNSTKSSFHK
jgi:FkbM family methyltransferase